MTFTPFETPEAALAACEAAGLEPLRGSDHQFGTKYGVIPPGFDRYINCYGDRDFLAWCNEYFRQHPGALTMPTPWIFTRRPGPRDAVDGLVLVRVDGPSCELAVPWQQAAQSYGGWRHIEPLGASRPNQS